MVNIEIHFSLSEKGQKAALLNHKNPRVAQVLYLTPEKIACNDSNREVEVATDDLWARATEVATINEYGQSSIQVKPAHNGGVHIGYEVSQRAEDPALKGKTGEVSLHGLDQMYGAKELLDIRAADLTLLAEEKVRVRGEVFALREERDQKDAQEKVKYAQETIVNFLEESSEHEDLPEVRALTGILKDRALGDTKDPFTGWREAIDEASLAILKREWETSQHASREAAYIEMAWIEANGSSYLKSLVEEGYYFRDISFKDRDDNPNLSSKTKYLNERLRKEMPGWGWSTSRIEDIPYIPEPEALATLREARKSLRKTKIKVDPPKLMVHRASSRYFGVVITTFLGKDVYFKR